MKKGLFNILCSCNETSQSISRLNWRRVAKFIQVLLGFIYYVGICKDEISKKNRTSFSLWVLHKLSLVCEIVIVIARQIHYYVQSIVLCKRHVRTLNYLIIIRVHSLILWQFSLNLKSTKQYSLLTQQVYSGSSNLIAVIMR